MLNIEVAVLAAKIILGMDDSWFVSNIDLYDGHIRIEIVTHEGDKEKASIALELWKWILRECGK